MPTGSGAQPTFADRAVALAWGAWVELGVSGWGRSHEGWAIDVEPLVLLTAFLEDTDARLREEATDWCVRNWRQVSKVRLRNLAHDAPEAVVRPFGEMAATVGAEAGATWPLATLPRPFVATGRSGAPDLRRPSVAWLRLRALFGVGARSEVLRHFLAGDGERSSAAQLATMTGYGKRAVLDECDSLARAGALSAHRVGNSVRYGLRRRAELEAFVGPLPPARPDWAAVGEVARILVTLERSVASSGDRLAAVDARLALDEMGPALDRLGLEGPTGDLRGQDLWPAVRAFGMETLGEWSVGRWTGRTFG